MLTHARTRGSAIAVAALSAIASHANAATLVYSDSYSGPTDFIQALQLPQFDPALGALLQIDVEIGSSLSGSFRVENTSAGSGGWAINTLDWDWTVDGLAQNLITAGQSLSQPFTPLAAFDGVLDFDGASGDMWPYGDSQDFVSAYTDLDPEFGQFIGLGTVDFTMSTEVFTSHTVFGGSSSSGFSTTAGFGVSITYTYNPIPAPGAAALFGVAGLLGARRRRA